MRFGLVGCGAMGSVIAEAFDDGVIRGTLTCLYDVDHEKAGKLSASLEKKPAVASTAAELIYGVDFVVEAASQEAVRECAPQALKAGRSILVMSVGALLDRGLMALLDEAAGETGAKVYLPSGAVAGIDALLAAACGGVEEVTLTTTKPPAGFKDVEYLRDRGVDVNSIVEPTVVYEGYADEAVRLFPRNINVAAIVSIACGRPVKVRIVADPRVRVNTHEVVARGCFGEVVAKTCNTPSPLNPGTSYLAALAAVASLRQVTGNVRVGN